MRGLWVFLSSVSLLACGDDSLDDGNPISGGGGSGSGGAPSGGNAPTAGGAGGGPLGGAAACDGEQGGATTTDFMAGGSRPVQVAVPSGYDAGTPAPLMILLHGYTASGDLQEAYFQLGPVAEANGMVYAHPDGTTDASDAQFWNASDACCDFGNTGVDDSAYLRCLVDEIRSRVNIDPKRIYFVGHSNGGFMSYRMACDHADVIAAFASLAGAMPLDTSLCNPSEPVSALQIHGTLDETIAYEGGTTVSEFPSAAESIGFWAERGGCDATPVDDATLLDLDSAVAGDETTASVFSNCSTGIDVELWTLTGSGHIPDVTADFRTGVVDWLLAHPKP